jgi:hypothetical protein
MKNIILILSVIALGGCAIANDLQLENSRHTTIGQELIDLKKAYDENIITAEEYDMLKQDIKKSASIDQQVKELSEK